MVYIRTNPLREVQMKHDAVTIPVGEGLSVSGVMVRPDSGSGERPSAVLIAHGAGGDMHHDFIVDMAEGLAAGGYVTLRFNFMYSEQGRKAPDTPRRLEEVWLAAANFVRHHPELSVNKLYLAGKSMGGRIASLLVADGRLEADGLVLFGYPLHPPGKKEKIRNQHFGRIGIPSLFIEGTRDPMCDLALLRQSLPCLGGPSALELIDGGDHSFKVLKSIGWSRAEVVARILSRTLSWLGNVNKPPAG